MKVETVAVGSSGEPPKSYLSINDNDNSIENEETTIKLYSKYISPENTPFKTTDKQTLIDNCSFFAKMFVGLSSLTYSTLEPLDKKDSKEISKNDKKLTKKEKKEQSKKDKKEKKDKKDKKPEKKDKKDKKDKKAKKDKKHKKDDGDDSDKDKTKSKPEKEDKTILEIKKTQNILSSPNSVSRFAPCMMFVNCPTGPSGLKCRILKESSITKLKSEICWNQYLTNLIQCQERGLGKCYSKFIDLQKTCKVIGSPKKSFSLFDSISY